MELQDPGHKFRFPQVMSAQVVMALEGLLVLLVLELVPVPVGAPAVVEAAASGVLVQVKVVQLMLLVPVNELGLPVLLVVPVLALTSGSA